ncbi:response regulator [Kaistia geumhonensis]|uniref:Two-component system phosphate regulon response regulator OmpR n=1 Tax=Kaistia geumhonensis TaxID=410839 RepID=A0ABU0M1T1_9HYPH|nr:response regulator [Kaistia geumhonensis]MCX5479877.1 response regulator [Kaistia geumhonensis]MDQ0514896.1 two-component system phosphate regulon response regulator OmpR [Kaistia geumhonensis]
MADPARRQEHLLVVDDDARIRQMLARYFEDEGYRVTTVDGGKAMRETMARTPVDLVMLDLMLGGENGLDLARELRAESDVPIIMLTGRDDVVDRIVGLEVGADDYIAKPFHLREVLARAKSILRRKAPAATAEDAGAKTIRFDGWQLDLDRRRLLRPDGADVSLTTGEFDILAVMARHPGRVFSRDMLMELTRGRSLDAFDRTIDAQIARLRRKIETDPAQPSLVKSVRGVGYVFTGKAG